MTTLEEDRKELEIHKEQQRERSSKLRKFKIIVAVGVISIIALILLFKFTSLTTLIENGPYIVGTLLIGAIVSSIAIHIDEKKEAKKPKDKVLTNDSFSTLIEDTIPLWLSNLARFVIFLTFHTVVSYYIWQALDYYIYEPLGREGFIKSTFDLITILALTYSIWDSFDMTTIPLYYAGEILYFGKPVFSNVPNGFTCLGLPAWLATDIRTVNFQKQNITVGLMKNDKREPFIVECNGFRAIFDVVFEFQASNTRKWLELQGNVEKRLVAEVNAVIYRFANMSKIDPQTKKILKYADGKEIKRFPDIDSLKGATSIVSEEITEEVDHTDPNTGEKIECLQTRFNRIGHTLLTVTIKDIENEDISIITAAQNLAATKISEQAEMLDLENTARKAKLMYDQLNEGRNPGDKEIFSMTEVMKAIERKEGGRKTFDGSGRNIIDGR